MHYFIVNPIAGNGLALKTEADLKAELERLRVEAVFWHTERDGHATELARQAAARPDCDTVVSVGGDGTSYEVASGLMGSGRALGIIPAGTGNDYIKSVGIPKEPLAALHALLEKPARPVDLATINGRPFLNVCGTGFDVMVLDQAERFKKRFQGLLPYMLGLLSAIAGYQPVHLEYQLDDGPLQEADALMCAVANGQYIGGGIPICPAANPADGQLDLVLLRHVPRRRIPLYLPGLMGKKVLSFSITTHLLVKKVRLRAKGMRVQMDGEIRSMDSAELEILPGALMLHW